MTAAADAAPVITDHPAKYSRSVMNKLGDIGRRWNVESILDPMAGVGGIHHVAAALGVRSVGVEIEPEWAAAHPLNEHGDATSLRFGAGEFDAVFTSPAYGNRMSDQYLGSPMERCRGCRGAGTVDAKECRRCSGSGKAKSTRRGYAVSLGRRVTPGSGAQFAQFNDQYRAAHRPIIAEMVRVARRLVVVNISDSFALGQRQYVAEWWLTETLTAGARFLEGHTVPTQRMGFGANRNARVDGEQVFVFGVEDARLEAER